MSKAKRISKKFDITAYSLLQGRASYKSLFKKNDRAYSRKRETDSKMTYFI